MPLMRWWPLGCLVLAVLSQDCAYSQLPDVALEVAVRKRENGELTPALKLFRLRCREGLCNLISLDLNYCRGEGEKPSFRPFVSVQSTLYGDFTVTSRSGLLTLQLTISEPGGPVDATLQMGYVRRIPSERAASRVTSFKGSGIMNPITGGKPVEVEYVPLVGASTPVRLGCAVELPGLEPENKSLGT